MPRSLRTGIGLLFLSGSALAQTAGSGVTSNRAVLDYDLGHGIRTELEGLTPRAGAARLASGGLTASSLMLNGLYEFSDGAWHMKPYVGAGFGMIDVNARIQGLNGNDWATAYQFRGGISLGFTQKLFGNVEYRWTMGSKPRFSLGGIPTKLEIDRHGFTVGVNYKY